MAILASANWYIRAGGDALNGGGYDAGISGAGTNYCDQDAPQLSLTDLATPGAGSTTLTSATGGFTAAMIGNCIRISAGTNFQTGYYFVTARTDTNTVTLDRTPTSGGAGSVGTGRLGGAFATMSGSLSTGGSVTAPTLTSPLAAGHTINIRGGGTDAPASADYTQTGYATYPSGNTTSGQIRVIGYNGRPRIDCGDIFHYQPVLWTYENLMFKFTGATNPDLGIISSPTASTNYVFALLNVRMDQAGYDRTGVHGSAIVRGCEFVNTGSTSAGTYPAVSMLGYGTHVHGTLVNGWRGAGVVLNYSLWTGTVLGNVVANTKATGGAITSGADLVDYSGLIAGNSIYGNAGDGIKFTAAGTSRFFSVVNNIIDSNAGYGINVSVGTTALNDRTKTFCDYNAFRNNTSGARNGVSAGSNDVALAADPFTNAAGGDFTLNGTAGGGAALKGVAFPTSIP